MIKGVSFELKQNKKGNVLSEIFSCIDVKMYNWYFCLDQAEVWENFYAEESLLEELYSGEEFNEFINSEKYILFVKIQAYKTCINQNTFKSILTYEEFLDDDCQLLILLADGEYVDIYAKDHVFIKDIYEHGKEKGFSNIEYITDDNDCREILNVC